MQCFRILARSSLPLQLNAEDLRTSHSHTIGLAYSTNLRISDSFISHCSDSLEQQVKERHLIYLPSAAFAGEMGERSNYLEHDLRKFCGSVSWSIFRLCIACDICESCALLKEIRETMFFICFALLCFCYSPNQVREARFENRQGLSRIQKTQICRIADRL